MWLSAWKLNEKCIIAFPFTVSSPFFPLLLPSPRVTLGPSLMALCLNALMPHGSGFLKPLKLSSLDLSRSKLSICINDWSCHFRPHLRDHFRWKWITLLPFEQSIWKRRDIEKGFENDTSIVKTQSQEFFLQLGEWPSQAIVLCRFFL